MVISMRKIVFKEIYKSFGDKTVFENFSLDLDANKNTSILGASGQGKTTLLNMLAGIEKADSGLIDRGDIKLSYVFQDPVLLPWATVHENLEYVARDKVDHAKIIEVLSKLSIEKEINSYPCQLSGGMRQRVALARAIMVNADVILMDEPFQNLDVKSKERSIQLYRELMENSGIHFIFVSHNIEEALRVADDLLILRGRNNRETLFYSDKEDFDRIRETIQEVID